MKKYRLAVPVILLLSSSFACQNKAARAELDDFRAQAEVVKQNKILAERYLKGVDSRDTAIFDQLLSADCKIYFPGSFEPISREQLKQVVSGFYKVFENISHKPEDLIAEGDRVVARTTDSATHIGEFMGLAPTGKTVKFGELHLFRMKDGKIVEYWIQEDFLWMNQQLGMELRPVGSKGQVSGVPVRTQGPAKPSPDHMELEAWAGNWTFQGYFKESPSGSASKLDWSWEGRWRPGGRFLEIHGVFKAAGSEDRYLEILGYDPEKGAWAGYVFHDGGILEIYTCAFDGLTCLESGVDRSPDGKTLRWRHVWKFSPDRMSVSGICEAEAEGAWWTVFEVKGVRSSEKEAKRP